MKCPFVSISSLKTCLHMWKEIHSILQHLLTFIYPWKSHFVNFDKRVIVTCEKRSICNLWWYLQYFHDFWWSTLFVSISSSKTCFLSCVKRTYISLVTHEKYTESIPVSGKLLTHPSLGLELGLGLELAQTLFRGGWKVYQKLELIQNIPVLCISSLYECCWYIW